MRLFNDWNSRHSKSLLCEENKEDILAEYFELTELLQLINDTEKSLNASIESCENIFNLLLHFNQSVCSKLGPMGFFWDNFIEVTQILLDYI